MVIRAVLRFVLDSIFLVLLLSCIPLAFDVGGAACGFSYSLSLGAMCFGCGCLRLYSAPRPRLNYLGALLYYSQLVAVPALLIAFLNAADWQLHHAGARSVYSVLVDMSSRLADGYSHTTPFWCTMETLCALLVLQAAGQHSRELARKSEFWMLAQITVAGILITGSLYALRALYTLNEPLTAALVGATLTLVSILGGYGIVSGNGAAIEAGMLYTVVAYELLMCNEEYYTDSTSTSANTVFGMQLLKLIWWSPTSHAGGGGAGVGGSTQELLPPHLAAAYAHTLAHMTHLVPEPVANVYASLLTFMRGALAPRSSVLFVALTVRLCVYYASSLVVPAPRVFREVSPSATRLKVARVLGPCVAIAAYTHLIMVYPPDAHAPSAVHVRVAQQLGVPVYSMWPMLGLFIMLVVYGFELSLGRP